VYPERITVEAAVEARFWDLLGMVHDKTKHAVGRMFCRVVAKYDAGALYPPCAGDQAQ
jgi:hypothetical protein